VSHADDTSSNPLKLPAEELKRPEEELKLPEEGLFEATPFGDQPATGTPDELFGEPGPAAEPAVEPADGKKKKREKKKKDRKEKKPAKAERPARQPGPPLLTKIRRASPYTVMLAVALGSLVILVLVLVLYLNTYGFKFHP
jgi:hypothetical protein